MNKYTPIIGLEVHVELKTNSKMFCSCSADYFGKTPNSHTCPVCLGLPGALPVPNKTAIEWCIKIALALDCNINEFSKFDRKNYFYPDLAKGYQISQYDLPFGYDGHVELSNKKHIRIRRVHMEEDTGKLTHAEGSSLIDFNRSGVPLVEIVTEPDFHDAKDVVEYLQRLQQIVQYLDVSNADMEKGDMRLEPNISLTTNIKELPNYKVEVKNINSFRFVEKTIHYEIKRQQEILEKGETPAQETRGWDEHKQKTFSQRSKEDAQDYRYFPEPDIPPITITKKKLDELKAALPEMPWDKEKKILSFGFPLSTVKVSTATISRAEFVEDAYHYAKENNIDPRGTVNYILNRRINDIPSLTPEQATKDYKAQTVMEDVDEKELAKLIDEVISENEKAVEDYKNGKEASLMFLLGQVMKKLGKKVDVQIVKTAIQKQL